MEVVKMFRYYDNPLVKILFRFLKENEIILIEKAFFDLFTIKNLSIDCLAIDYLDALPYKDKICDRNKRALLDYLWNKFIYTNYSNFNDLAYSYRYYIISNNSNGATGEFRLLEKEDHSRIMNNISSSYAGSAFHEHSWCFDLEYFNKNYPDMETYRKNILKMHNFCYTFIS